MLYSLAESPSPPPFIAYVPCQTQTRSSSMVGQHDFDDHAANVDLLYSLANSPSPPPSNVYGASEIQTRSSSGVNPNDVVAHDHNVHQLNSVVHSPVYMDGMECYEAMLVEQHGNLDHSLHISDEARHPDESVVGLCPKVNDTKSCSSFLTTIRPSFDLHFESLTVPVSEEAANPSIPSPVVTHVSSNYKIPTPYTNAKSKLIVVIEEGQSMYKRFVNDHRYKKISIVTDSGLCQSQLQLRNEFTSPMRAGSDSTLHAASSDNVIHVRLSPKTPSASFPKDISSPEFWELAAESADIISLEKTVRPKKNFTRDDLSDVVRRIDFSATKSAEEHASPSLARNDYRDN
ncbi:hypothetical protein ZOSMA_28G00530 [Zostera marina]|uniref:Uncharacterized protein n=1 Tax=Zostera marina TaxID=29655 RepID=A0A0K9PEQ9_ZOSMR|nr:hypothetical protein ZOSMA_28G00530 [Zostera marina]